VKAVPQLVRDGAHLVEGAVEVAQHSALLDGCHTHAERAAALAFALFRVDPSVIEGAFCERAQIRRESAEVLQHKSRGLLKRVDLVGPAQGSKDVPPGEFLLAQLERLGLEVPAEHRERAPHGLQHGLEWSSCQCAPHPVRSGRRPFGRGACSACSLALDPLRHAASDSFTDSQAAFSARNRAARVFIRVRAQIDERRHGQLLHLAVEFKVHREL